MSNPFHLLTRPRRPVPAARRSGGPRHRVRLAVWELESLILPALGLSPSDSLAFQVPAQALSLPPGALALPFVATAPQAGAPPVVRFSDPQTGARQFSL